jgi:S-DNA-T family DNA segregation ATPase FtsK/SpoIIIE
VLCVGVDVVGEDVSFDLASAPHLLVGGTTGAGKSVCLHSLILSLLLQNDKNNLKLALIDPKRVEFANYSKLSNLYKDSIATEISEAKEFLKDLVDEMEARYSDFEKLNVSNIYEARKKGRSMPFIVLLIEEMADLILQDKGIEPLIVRLVAKARASGIHLVVATQRPDSETFSGLLRSNVPTRIALTVQKGSESRIILDEQGAENLLGAGDMLLKIPGEQIRRAHGVFVKQEDIASILTKL